MIQMINLHATLNIAQGEVSFAGAHGSAQEHVWFDSSWEKLDNVCVASEREASMPWSSKSQY